MLASTRGRPRHKAQTASRASVCVPGWLQTRKNVVDFWGKKEYLYLGPDEQIIPDDIVWIVKQVRRQAQNQPPGVHD